MKLGFTSVSYEWVHDSARWFLSSEGSICQTNFTNGNISRFLFRECYYINFKKLPSIHEVLLSKLNNIGHIVMIISWIYLFFLTQKSCWFILILCYLECGDLAFVPQFWGRPESLFVVGFWSFAYFAQLSFPILST